MSADDMQRAVWRMAHEIIEHNHGLDDIVLIGLQTGGVPLGHRLAETLQQIENVSVPQGSIDVAFYPGRTIRAALDALADFGRAKAVQLAVMVDRGHRELPIRPDYVGKNLPTSHGERIQVQLVEVDEVDRVLLIP